MSSLLAFGLREGVVADRWSRWFCFAFSFRDVAFGGVSGVRGVVVLVGSWWCAVRLLARVTDLVAVSQTFVKIVDATVAFRPQHFFCKALVG